jgi:alpha-glucosidase (family GH31 glycosyl hydrolase)
MNQVLSNGESLSFTFLEDEYWWGGRVVDGHLAPYRRIQPFSTDLSEAGGNQVMPLFVSSRGRVLWSKLPFLVEIDGDGSVSARIDPTVLERRPGGEVQLLQVGETLADAFGYARQRIFAPDGELPAELMFTRPQYNLWIELLYDATQHKVIEYAQNLLEAGFPPGVLMIDDAWPRDYGDWDFRHDRFPDPAAMVRQLHDLGFKVMLWVCPFVSPDGKPFLDHHEEGRLLRDNTGEPAVRRWWNGYSALHDLTNPVAVDWFINVLEDLRQRYGIDGFKIDAGDPSAYRLGDQATLPDALPTDQTHAFGKLGRRFEYTELKATFNNAGLGVAQRLRDKHHNWSGENGVASLIPHALAAAMTGHPYICPDMIGGGEWLEFTGRTNPLDPELFVRYAQVAACMPMMQFSAAPWRVLDERHRDLCRQAAELHVELADTIMELARHAAATGEPILRPLDYVAPGQGLETVNDQFFLGPDLMIAPAVTPRCETRSVRLPAGQWIDDRGDEWTGSQTIQADTPLDRAPRYRRRS